MTRPIPRLLDEPAQEARSGIAQYVQLASLIRHDIAHGVYLHGDQLPTVAQMADKHRVARITVRQAYGVLAHEGLITSQRGRGTFVTVQPSAYDGRLRSAINDPRVQDVRFDVLEQQHGVPLPAMLARGAPTYPGYAYLRKVHLHDGEPFCLAEIHVASEIQARFPAGAERERKIAYLVEEHAPGRMRKVQQTTTVGPADQALAKLLGCGFAAPVAHMVRRIFDDRGRIALAGLFWYRGDRFIADMEVPFGVWLNYPGVILPEARNTGTGPG